MDKMRMESPDMTAQNIDRIAALFPNCITEMLDEEHSTPEKLVWMFYISHWWISRTIPPMHIWQNAANMLRSTTSSWS